MTTQATKIKLSENKLDTTRLEPRTARCVGCEPLVCGIDRDCIGHQVADRAARAATAREAQRRFIVETVQDYLAKALPDAVRHLVEHGGNYD
jgi:hypothetical protein